jgi:hypothetical protein
MGRYTVSEDAQITARNLPDGLLAKALGKSEAAIVKRRRAIRVLPSRMPALPDDTEPVDRAPLLREEVAALHWRVRDAEKTLRELRQMLAAKERELSCL